jgi:hypothetical protein
MFFLPEAPLDIVVYLSALSLMGCPAGVCRPRSAVCVIDHAEALNRCQQPRGRVHNPPVGRGELKKHRLQSRLSLPVRRLFSGLLVIRQQTNCFVTQNGSLLPSSNRVHLEKDLLKQPAVDWHPAARINIEVASSWKIGEAGADASFF